MVNKGSLLLSAFFALVGLTGIIFSIGFRYWESMLLPLATSSVIFILSVIQLVRDFGNHTRRKAPLNTVQDTINPVGKSEIARGVIILGWSVAFVLATYLLGFYIAIPVFGITYLKKHSRSWFTSILFAVIFLVIIYLVFGLLLKTTLYKGLFFNLFD